MNELTTVSSQNNNTHSHCFSSMEVFKSSVEMATYLSQSTMVPKEYQNNVPNCLIALDITKRTTTGILMVMQNLHIIHGRPGWSSQFIISAINTCGRFRQLRFDFSGVEGSDERACVAWTTEKEVDLPKNIRTLTQAKAADIPVLEGPKVSISIAKKEGWYGKTGSKWQTMPELMLHYRAASFFGKLYAPEILMGMQTAEEVQDMVDVTPAKNENLSNAIIASATHIEKTSTRMDEILSPPKEVEAVIIEEEFNVFAIAEKKCNGIIKLLEKASKLSEIDNIMKEAQVHVSSADESLKIRVREAREAATKRIKGINSAVTNI